MLPQEISVSTIVQEDPYDSKTPVALHTIRALHERPMILGDKWMMKTTQDRGEHLFLASLPVVVCDTFIYNTCIAVSSYRSIDTLIEFVRVLNGMFDKPLGDEQTVAEIIFKKSK